MPIKITFQQLIDEFSVSTGRTKAFSKEFIKDVFVTIQEGLRRDENVNIKGLGIFKLQEVAERETVNPKTGKATLIPAHKKVVFKAEKALREKVNEKYEKLKTKKIKKKESPKPLPEILVAPPKPPVVKPLDKEPLTFGEPVPEPKLPPKKQPPPPPPPSAPKNDKKIMPTFVIEEKKKKSAWRWLLPLLLLIFIFIVIYIVPTKFDSIEDLAFWRNWNWAKDTIPDHPTVVETTVVEVEISPIEVAESIFIQAPIPNLQLSETTPVEVKEPILEKKERDIPPVKIPEPVSEPEDEASLIHVIKQGNTLWGLSRQYYSRSSLWPNIYRKNVETLRTPDLLIVGRKLLIPELQGEAYQLSKTDSARIAQGYYLAYRAYKKYDEEKAEGYLKVAKKFSTTLDY